MVLLTSTLLLTILSTSTVLSLNDQVCKSSFSQIGQLSSATVSSSTGIGLAAAGEWCGKRGKNTVNWIEFDFASPVGIRGVQISKPGNAAQEYVTKFSLQYAGLQGTTLLNYGSDPNSATVIDALDSTHTSIDVTLTGVVVTKLRINVENFQREPCMKIDLLGCTNYKELCSSPCQNGGECFFEDTCACPSGFDGQLCENQISSGAGCVSRLGMSDGTIPTSALSVSSSGTGHGKEKARYDCCAGENEASWCPASSDTNPWYEVSFDKPQTVGGLDFQYPLYPFGVVPAKYMKNFELQFWSPLDAQKTWRTFSQGITAIANDTTYYTIQLQPSITVNAIRILPESYKTAACFRFEVLGCDPAGLCSAGYCLNGGSCMGQNVCLCAKGFFGDRCEKTASQLVTITAGFHAIVNQILQTTTTIKFTVHGNVQLVPGQNGQAIHITGGNQYVVIDKDSFTSCLNDLDNCKSGFTIKTSVFFSQLTDNTYIISSGGNLPNTKGIALYYQNHQLHFVVSTSTQKWHLVTSHQLTLNTWHHLELSWQKTLGCELIDNGKIVGSVTQPVPHHATQVHQIAIGHGYTTSTTHISMKVEGFKTVDANRASLAIAGIMTTSAPATTVLTTKTTTPTPVITTAPTTDPPTTVFSCGAKETQFDFKEIKNNLLITPEYNFTVYNNPIIRPEQDGKAVLVLNTTGQYVELPNKGIECIQDMTTCQNGFTISLEIKWLDMNSTNKRYIISSGADKVNNSGLAMYLWHGELYCAAKKDRTIWTAKAKLNVKEGEWHSYQISWNMKDGFQVFLDGHIFMEHTIKLPNPAQPGTYPLLIAGTPGNPETSLMEVRNLFSWTASRDVLINNTCITEFPTVQPTSTEFPTVQPTTTEPTPVTITTLDLTFIKIEHNIITTPSFNITVHGNPKMEILSINIYPVLVLNGSNQYLEFPKGQNLGCLEEMSSCQSGFTIKINVNLLKVSHEQKTVIISNGNEYMNGSGMGLYFYHGHLYAYVSTTHTWKVETKYKVEINQWHKYEISWSVSHGLVIIVDGHQVGTTTEFTKNNYTSVPHSLTIGKWFSAMYTTSMKITGLKIWQASHHILIQHGLMSTPEIPPVPTAVTTTTTPTAQATTTMSPTTTTMPPTTTTVSPTTTTMLLPTTTVSPTTTSTSPTTTMSATTSTVPSTSASQSVTSSIIKTVDMTFIAISHNVLMTHSYNLTVHGNPYIEQNNITKSPVLVLNGSNEYLEFKNDSEVGCLSSLNDCDKGFTVKVSVNLLKVSHEQETVIISNGNEYMNGSGMGLYFYHGHLYAYVSTTHTWKVETKYKVEINQWHKYEISWSVSHGLVIIVDGHQVGTTTEFTKNNYTSVPHSLTIGKWFSATYTTSMKITGLKIWQASHHILIQHGLMSTPEIPPVPTEVTTTTTVSPTTTTMSSTTTTTSPTTTTASPTTTKMSQTTTTASPTTTTTSPTTTTASPTTTTMSKTTTTASPTTTTMSQTTTTASPTTTTMSPTTTTASPTTTTMSPTSTMSPTATTMSPTTTTTTVPSTSASQSVTSSIIKTVDMTFIAISHNVLMTHSYNLTVHGNPYIEQNNITKSPVLVLNGSNEYLEFKNDSKVGCLSSLNDCDKGFTVKVSVNLLKVSHEQKTVIISNGNEYMNGSGMGLYFYHGHLYAYVSTTHTWKVETKYKVEINQWHKYEISWSVSHGLVIIVDDHQVGTTTEFTKNNYTSVPHSLTIGKWFSATYTTSMKITALKIWQASHHILIQHGLMSTPVAPTSSPTTPKMDIPKYEWSFVNIPHGQTIIGSQFNATISGSVSVNTSTGINFNNGFQHIDLGEHKDLCFGNLSLCSCGITIKITIMFTKLEENTVIISSGAEHADGTGLALVYRYGQFHCIVSNNTDTWFSTIKRETLFVHQFHQVIISWSPSHGLKVIVNSHVINSVTTSIKHHLISHSTEHMYIGNPPGMSSSLSCNYFMMSVVIWHCWVDNVVGEGELTTPIPEKTTVAPATELTTKPMTPTKWTKPTLPGTTDFCRTGYVCKDDLTSARPPRTTAATRPSTQKTSSPTKVTEPPTVQTSAQATNQKTTNPASTAKPTTTKPTNTPATTKPTTGAPTTPKPTTAAQTTTRPTTAAPTTAKPTTAKPTTPRPSLPSYIGIPHLRPGVDQGGMAHFVCEFTAAKEPNVELVVCLAINGKCVIQRVVTGSSVSVTYTIAQINQNLFKQQVTCTVEARWKGETVVTPIKTSNIITPDIKLVTTHLVLTEGHTHQNIVVNVTTPPQMFCCQGCQGNCQVTITTHANWERFYQFCSRTKYIAEVLVGWHGPSQSPDSKMCGTTVPTTTHISSWQQIVNIPVVATVDGRIDRNTQNHFTVQAHVVNQPKPPVTAIPHTLNVGKVQITANNNDRNSQCASLNDPHMTTFDGRRYDNHNGGEFILYQHTSLPYEVRGYNTKCSSRGRAYCNCAAAIKSGDDVITFDSCGRFGNMGNGGGHGHGHHGHNYQRGHISVELYKNGELTPGTKILRIGCGQKYQVILPTGTIVTIMAWGRGPFINIWIKPSSVDRGNTQGLCGSYDGNRNNDVYHPNNGAPDHSRYPTSFCMKWKQSQTIFLGVSAAAFNHLNTFCSCINGKEVFCDRGHGIMSCVKSRYDITDAILRQAKIPHLSHRHRRQAVDPVTTPTTIETNNTVNFTDAEAYEKCTSVIENNKAVKACWNTVNRTDLNETMENCASDLMDTGDENWALGYITDIVEECLNTLARNVEIVNGTVTPVNEEAAANVTQLCEPECGPHGTCTQGVCACSPGYAGLQCEFSAADTVPTVLPPAAGSCGCDRRATDDCRTVTIFGDNFVQSPSLTCHYEFTEMAGLEKPTSLGRSVLAEYISITQVTCTLPEVKEGVHVSVSNNGQRYSSDWYLHTAYDSVCFDCDQTTATVKYTRRDFTCIINGVCFASGVKKNGDSCKECDPSNSESKWTESKDQSCTQCNSATDIEKVSGDEDKKQTTTILAVVIGVLCFVVIASLFYICKLRSKSSLYRKEMGLTDAYAPSPAMSYHNDGYSNKNELNEKM